MTLDKRLDSVLVGWQRASEASRRLVSISALVCLSSLGTAIGTQVMAGVEFISHETREASEYTAIALAETALAGAGAEIVLRITDHVLDESSRAIIEV